MLEKRKEIDGFSEKRYMSNYEAILDQVKVRLCSKSAPLVLN